VKVIEPSENLKPIVIGPWPNGAFVANLSRELLLAGPSHTHRTSASTPEYTAVIPAHTSKYAYKRDSLERTSESCTETHLFSVITFNRTIELPWLRLIVRLETSALLENKDLGCSEYLELRVTYYESLLGFPTKYEASVIHSVQYVNGWKQMTQLPSQVSLSEEVFETSMENGARAVNAVYRMITNDTSISAKLGLYLLVY